VIQVRAALGGRRRDREAEKKRSAACCPSNGAEHVAFYGKWQIEEIQLGA
jgi:DUF1680 family protein